jgi:hypothetical protein
LDNAIAMINPTTYTVTEFPVPAPANGPSQIAVGPDGNLWFSEVYETQIGMINATTHAITEIPMPGGVGGITAGSGGDLWLTLGNPAAIGGIDTATLALTTFPVTNPANGFGSQPQGITVGPDGKLWFADTNGYGIGVLDPPTLPPVIPGVPFGFTLSVKPGSSVGKAAYRDTVALALADGTGGDTLTVSTAVGVSTYSGLTLTKHGGSYRLVTDSVSPVKASARRASVVNARPMLIENVLTTGTGKRKHVIGVEIAFNRSLDRSLAKVIARRSLHFAGQPMNVRVGASSSRDSAGASLRGEARFGPSGLIVVFAKA